MKIEHFDGCTSGGMAIDNKGSRDYSDSELIDIAEKLLKLALASKNKESVIFQLLDGFFDYDYEQDEEPCDGCGDYCSVQTWEVDIG